MRRSARCCSPGCGRRRTAAAQPSRPLRREWPWRSSVRRTARDMCSPRRAPWRARSKERSRAPSVAGQSGLWWCSWRLPAAALALILFCEPRLERREVVEDRRSVHLPRAGELLECVLPRLARAESEHLAEALARLFIAVDRALIQRSLVARRFTQRAVELELQDVRKEVTC